MYELNGFVPPKLLHTVETKSGSIFGDIDHVIIKWQGDTLEGVICVCDDVNLPKDCVVENSYEASVEDFFFGKKIVKKMIAINLKYIVWRHVIVRAEFLFQK